MKESFPGGDFLKKKYDLHKAPEVEEQANLTEDRSGEKVSQDPATRIQNYLSHGERIKLELGGKTPEEYEKDLADPRFPHQR